MYFATPEKCKTWLRGAHPDMYLKIYGDDGTVSSNDNRTESVKESMQTLTIDDRDEGTTKELPKDEPGSQAPVQGR